MLQWFWTWIVIAAGIAGIVLGIWASAVWWWLAVAAGVVLIAMYAGRDRYSRRPVW